MKGNTKYYNLFEEVCEEGGLIIDEADHCLWSRPIKKQQIMMWKDMIQKIEYWL